MTDLLHFLSKYDVPGPRYTSYPTVPAWAPLGETEYRAHLRSVNAEDPLSLYFHLPFCETLCHFCGCMQVITKDHSRSRVYVDAVKQELARVAEFLSGKMTVTQLHFGGGTPNFLQPEELIELVEEIKARFTLAPAAEVAIEMHPRTSTVAFCEALAKLPFNRISLGVQDFDPTVQALINRHQSYEMTQDMLLLLRELGFDSINFDLIYGLPGQTRASFADTLDKVLVLKPNRLAVYSYAHVPWVRPIQRAFKEADLPSPALKLQLFQHAYDVLTQNGYLPIGMDHFALESDALVRALREGKIHRNFMGYSTQSDAHQIGVGVSAISYVNGNYFQNEKKLETYYAALEQRELATFRGMMLTAEDRLRRALIMELMCRMRLDIRALEQKFETDFSEHFAREIDRLAPFVEDGLLAINDEAFEVCGRGHLFLRNMAMVFDEYLEKIQRVAVTPTFSRTV